VRFHFKNNKGWLGCPSGFLYSGGQYHVFFGHYPHAKRHGTMHWGHAVSRDLIDWYELPIALTPGEEGAGCMPGCAILHGSKTYLFYTVEDAGKEIVRRAFSSDGIAFTEDESFRLETPLTDGRVFRAPKVFEWDGTFFMLIASSQYGLHDILLFKSPDFDNWEYVGPVTEGLSDMGALIESPDLYKIEDKWILSFQISRAMPHKVLFATGDFDGEKFKRDSDFFPIETGPNFLSPVSCEGPDGERIVIGWLYDHLNNRAIYAAPRELFLDLKDNLCSMPAGELKDYMVSESRFVEYDHGMLTVKFEGRTLYSKPMATEPDISVLEDIGTVEIFLNGGRESVSLFIC